MPLQSSTGKIGINFLTLLAFQYQPSFIWLMIYNQPHSIWFVLHVCMHLFLHNAFYPSKFEVHAIKISVLTCCISSMCDMHFRKLWYTCLVFYFSFVDLIIIWHNFRPYFILKLVFITTAQSKTGSFKFPFWTKKSWSWISGTEPCWPPHSRSMHFPVSFYSSKLVHKLMLRI